MIDTNFFIMNDLKGDNIVLTSTNLSQYSIRIYELSESQKEQ